MSTLQEKTSLIYEEESEKYNEKEVNNRNGGDLRTAWQCYQSTSGQGLVVAHTELPAVRAVLKHLISGVIRTHRETARAAS